MYLLNNPVKIFKRDIFDILVNTLKENSVIFLTGPRKTGKTVALMQLSKEYGYEYIDFKSKSAIESMDIINQIEDDIRNGISKVYLLDESTYIHQPDLEIAKLAESYAWCRAEGKSVNTKIVFTGSQAIALESWGRSAFCNLAAFLKLDFLSYAEWLRFQKREDITEESYQDFIMGTSEFYSDFHSLKEYLEGCLTETVLSNSKAVNYIRGNDCDLVEADTLISLLYLTLFTLHNNTSSKNFFRPGNFEQSLIYLSKQYRENNPYCPEEIANKFAQTFLYKYDHVHSIPFDELKQSYAFLLRCGLITATPVFDNFHSSLSVLKHLESRDGYFQKKGDLFGKVNFTINYPMFYVEILKEIFGQDMVRNIPNFVKGSIVECQVRGLLARTGQFEFHDDLDREIDYINPEKGEAVEISVSNKKVMQKTHFDLLPKEISYQKYLLTRDVEDVFEEIIRIPYYKFIYGNRGFERRIPEQVKEEPGIEE